MCIRDRFGEFDLSGAGVAVAAVIPAQGPHGRPDRSVKLGGLVLDVEGNLLELVLMHVCVVSAEQ